MRLQQRQQGEHREHHLAALLHRSHQRRKDALREAQKNPDIKAIVDNLKKVKTLKSNEPVLTPAADFVIQKNTKAILVRG